MSRKPFGGVNHEPDGESSDEGPDELTSWEEADLVALVRDRLDRLDVSGAGVADFPMLWREGRRRRRRHQVAIVAPTLLTAAAVAVPLLVVALPAPHRSGRTTAATPTAGTPMAGTPTAGTPTAGASQSSAVTSPSAAPSVAFAAADVDALARRALPGFAVVRHSQGSLGSPTVGDTLTVVGTATADRAASTVQITVSALSGPATEQLLSPGNQGVTRGTAGRGQWRIAHVPASTTYAATALTGRGTLVTFEIYAPAANPAGVTAATVHSLVADFAASSL